MTKMRRVFGSVLVGLAAISCGGVDSTSISEEELTAQSEQGLTTRRVDMGAIPWGTIQQATITNTSSTSYYHAWRFSSTQPRVVTFMLEMLSPQGAGSGAWMYVTDPIGFKLKEVKLPASTRAHFEFNFTFQGTYYVIVRPVTATPGSTTYRLGAEAHTCAFLEYPSPDPMWAGVTIVRVENLLPGAVQDPWTYSPSDPAIPPGTAFSWRDAFLGSCDLDPDSDENPITASLCAPTDPPVCGATTMSGTLSTNKCGFRDWVANDTADPGAWAGAYTTDLDYCQPQ